MCDPELCVLRFDLGPLSGQGRDVGFACGLKDRIWYIEVENEASFHDLILICSSLHWMSDVKSGCALQSHAARIQLFQTAKAGHNKEEA